MQGNKMKIIPYKSKVTNANTNYKETRFVDTKWVLDQCKTLVLVADTEGDRLLALNPKMPKQSTGHRNSPKSMCEGVIDNFNNGQYNFSDKTMQGITESFRIGEELIEDFEAVEFVEVDTWPKISVPKTPEVSTSENTFTDLFDIESIVVNTTTVYKRK